MDQIVLPSDVLQLVRQRQELISQQRHMLQCLELEFKLFLQEQTGANMNESWHLDITRGVLSKMSEE